MKWYVAKLIFQIICGNGNHTPQFEEQLRLVQEDNEEAAFHKSVSIGTSQQEVFYNDKQQLVQWKFINVSELSFVILEDEAGLYSKINEVDDAEAHIAFIHYKAAQLHKKHAPSLLQLL